MLFARTISRLARQLFSDVIGIGYVEGEIVQPPQSVCVLEDPDHELLNSLLTQYESDKSDMLEFISEISNTYKIAYNQVVQTLIDKGDDTRLNFETWKQRRNKNEKVINIDSNGNNVN
jgi:uncharacterized protein YdiU (UPF0061 family)